MMTGTSLQPEIVQYGPYRVIGLRYAGKYEHEAIQAVWGGEGGFITRFGEVISPVDGKWPGTDRHPAFGLCRCIPGATDGSLEYIAATVATPDAPIPAGMVEVSIPAGPYAVFAVDSLEHVMEAIRAAGKWLEGSADWEAFCGPDGCDCANHPSFELYPPDFGEDGRLFVYISVRPRT